MNNIGQANQQDISQKPELCHGCFQFFGNPQNNNLCSKCFKGTTKPETYEQPQKIEEQQPQPATVNIQNQKEEQKMEIEEQSKKQVNPQICYKCPKKIGYLGYKCKCEFTFCKFHRLPEDHQCDFDFQNEGKAKLTKENPLVLKSKLEKNDNF